MSEEESAPQRQQRDSTPTRDRTNPSVRSAVNEVINGLMEERGLRLLGDEELQPDADEATPTA